MSVTEASRRIPRPHHNYVPEYQMSGIPHVETRTLAARANNAAVIAAIDSHKFTFGSVTRWIVINNHSNNAGKHLRVYFNETAAKTAYDSGNNDITDPDSDLHYFLINGDEQTQRLEITLLIFLSKFSLTTFSLGGKIFFIILSLLTDRLEVRIFCTFSVNAWVSPPVNPSARISTKHSFTISFNKDLLTFAINLQLLRNHLL